MTSLTPSANILPPIELLELMSDGLFHSGQELAVVLGVSRTTIWKQLAKLDALGLDVESQAGKGYRLVKGLELLNGSRIEGSLSDVSRQNLSGLDILPVLDSTNAHLLRADAKPDIHVCFAEYQTAGRGRRGRVWVSSFATNLSFSIKMTVETGISAFEGLSLAVGVAIVRALSLFGAADIQLKWPNDIIWSGKKLGGVLIDVTGDPAGRCSVVIGIGLNLGASTAMATQIEQPWVSLQEVMGNMPSRNAVAAELLNQLIPMIVSYERDGFQVYQSEWWACCAHANLAVNLQLGEKTETGVACGVTEVGALILRSDDLERAYYGGEVSLRMLK